MPHFKLFASGGRTYPASEIIVGKDDEGNKFSLSIHEARELPEEFLDDAKRLAGRLGLKVGEAEPEEKEEDRQPMGDDVRGMSPPNVGPGGGQPGAGQDTPSTSAPTGTPAPGTTDQNPNPGGPPSPTNS